MPSINWHQKYNWLELGWLPWLIACEMITMAAVKCKSLPERLSFSNAG